MSISDESILKVGNLPKELLKKELLKEGNRVKNWR
jgi:hypothetical protein